MSEVSVNLNDELQRFVDEEVQRGHFDNAGDYITNLLMRAREGQQNLESLLIAGLDSGNSVPLDDSEWDRIRGEARDRQVG